MDSLVFCKNLPSFKPHPTQTLFAKDREAEVAPKTQGFQINFQISMHLIRDQLILALSCNRKDRSSVTNMSMDLITEHHRRDSL